MVLKREQKVAGKGKRDHMEKGISICKLPVQIRKKKCSKVVKIFVSLCQLHILLLRLTKSLKVPKTRTLPATTIQFWLSIKNSNPKALGVSWLIIKNSHCLSLCQPQLLGKSWLITETTWNFGLLPSLIQFLPQKRCVPCFKCSGTFFDTLD